MRIFTVTAKDLRRFLGDRRALVVSLALPLVLTFIMGLSFGGGMFGSSGISAIEVALVGEGLPTALRDRLTEGLEESGFFAATWADSATADKWVRHGDVSAALVFPDDLLKRFLRFEDVPVQVWQDPGSPLKSGIVASVVSRALRSYQAGEAAYLALWPEDRSDPADSSSAQLLESYFAGDFATLWKKWRRSDEDPVWVEFQNRTGRIMDRQIALGDALGQPAVVLQVQDKVPAEESVGSGDVNLFNYFLPTFAVFFLMFGAAAATRDVHRERAAGTLQRQLLSPLAAAEFILGKWLSATVQGLFQLMVLFLAGALLYQVNLGSDPWSLPVAVLLTCTTAASVFLFLAVLSRNEKISDNLGTIVVLVSAMLGGNMVPIDQLPPWIHSIGRLFFNYWANLSFSQVMVADENLFDKPLPVFILVGATVALLSASLLVFTIRQRRGGLL